MMRFARASIIAGLLVAVVGLSGCDGGAPVGANQESLTASMDKYDRLLSVLRADDASYWGTYDKKTVQTTADALCRDLANGKDQGFDVVSKGLGITVVTEASTKVIATFTRQAALNVCPQFSTPGS